MPTAQVDCWALLAPELLQEIFKQFSVEECGSLRLVCRSWSTAAVGSPETWAESVQLPVCAVACDADTALFDRLAQRLPFVSRLRLHHTWRAQCDAAAADALQRLARWRQLDALEIRDSSSCRRSAQPSGFPTHWSLPPHAAEAVDLSHLRSLELLVQELGCGRGRSPWERLLESPSLASGLRRLSLRWVAVDTDIIHQHDPPASSAAGPMRTADALWHIHGRMTQLEHLSLAGCDLDELDIEAPAAPPRSLASPLLTFSTSIRSLSLLGSLQTRGGWLLLTLLRQPLPRLRALQLLNDSAYIRNLGWAGGSANLVEVVVNRQLDDKRLVQEEVCGLGEEAAQAEQAQDALGAAELRPEWRQRMASLTALTSLAVAPTTLTVGPVLQLAGHLPNLEDLHIQVVGWDFVPEELPSAPFTSLPWLRLRALMVEGVDGVVISPAVVSALCSGLTQLEQMHFVNCVSTLYDAHAHLADHLTKLLRLRRFTFDVEMGMEQEIGRNWRPASQPVLSKLLSALTALEALHLASDGVDAGIDLRVYTQLRHLSLDVVPVFTGGGVSNVPIEIDTCTLPPLLTSLALAGVTLKRSNPPSPSLMQQQQRQQQQQPPQQQPADGSRHLAPEAAGPSFLSNPVTSCISDAQLSLLPLPPGLNHLWISRCTWDASWLPLPGGAWTPQTVESLTAHLAAPASWPTPEPFVRALQQLPSLRSLAVIKQCHQCYKAWGMPGREDCTYHAPLLPASLGLTQLTSLGVMVRQPRQLEALATRLAQGRRLKQLWLSLVPYAHTGSAELAEGDWKDAVLKLGVLTSLESLWIGGCRHSTPIAASTLETWKEALALALPRLCVMPLDIECSWINWSGAPMCAAAPPVTRGSNGPRTAARAAAPSLRPYDWWSADAWGWS